MPVDFPDMKSLIMAGECHKFRAPNEGETEIQYRIALANHVRPIDFIESEEIRNGKGWDKWDDRESKNMLLGAMLNSFGKQRTNDQAHPGKMHIYNGRGFCWCGAHRDDL